MPKTYEDLKSALGLTLAASNNQGEPVLSTEEDVERASVFVEAAGGRYA